MCIYISPIYISPICNVETRLIFCGNKKIRDSLFSLFTSLIVIDYLVYRYEVFIEILCKQTEEATAKNRKPKNK